MSISNGVFLASGQADTVSDHLLPAGETLALLERGFGVEFSVVDGTSGELLHASGNQPGRDWQMRAELCREVARRGQPEFIEEESPFLVLALPVPAGEEERHVAVATFLTRPVAPGDDVSQAAARLGMEPEEAADWASRQTPWAAEVLERVGHLVVEQMAGNARIRELEAETQSLSVHVAATYEEISLLHRLTQNLKISESDEDLGRVALEWMQEVLPAEGLAIQLIPVTDGGEPLAHRGRAESVLLTFGQCPLDNQQFGRLVDYLDPRAANRPIVVNHATTQEGSWPFPEIRQMVIVPLAEGENLFGWLAGFNHVTNSEFGTVEANLLSSVGAILGIHSGNIELYRQQSELLAGVVRALTSAIDAKDPYTCGHSDRVARVSVRLAEELGCDPESVNTIYLSGLLHDIGKIGINDNVLRKPGKLTDSEYEHIKTHVEIGHRILLDLKKLDGVRPVVLHHHESWDGRGYPDGLPNEQIPLAARILAVADSFDAMGSDRPYRKGLPDEKIDEIFRAGAGKQWDPKVVAAFFRAREDIRRIMHSEAPDDPVDLRPRT